MASPSSLIGKQIDNYKLDLYIASGAMGMVYKATDLILNRTVALKLAPKDQDPTPEVLEARMRLKAEARNAGVLSHANIVTIYAYGETDEYQYISMEYVEGKTLSQIVEKRKHLPIEEAAELFEQILRALEAAGKAGIVHRDIKPSNIIIRDEDGEVKVTDFGISKRLSVSMTTTGTMLGTPNYMSPEQITGREVDVRSDIFALGAVMYQVLTGRLPFEGNDVYSLTYKILQEDPTPANVANPAVSPHMALVIRKAMAKDPGERYQTPREMLAEIKKTLSSGGVDPAELLDAEATIAARGLPRPMPEPPARGAGAARTQTGLEEFPRKATRAKRMRLKQFAAGVACLVTVVALSWYGYQRFHPLRPAIEAGQGQAATAPDANRVEDRPANHGQTATPEPAVEKQAGSDAKESSNTASIGPIEQPIVSIQAFGLQLSYVSKHGGMGEFKAFGPGATLYSGDRYKLLFNPDQDCYVYIYQVDAANQVSQLFPMAELGGVKIDNLNPVTAHKEYTLPAPDKSFVLDRQVGRERIYLLVAKEHNHELEELYQKIEAARQRQKPKIAEILQRELANRLDNKKQVVEPVRTGQTIAVRSDDGRDLFEVVAERLETGGEDSVYVVGFDHR